MLHHKQANDQRWRTACASRRTEDIIDRKWSNVEDTASERARHMTQLSHATPHRSLEFIADAEELFSGELNSSFRCHCACNHDRRNRLCFSMHVPGKKHASE